jgi:energy-coupling factor transporter ATP-binding protein EcfA2
MDIVNSNFYFKFNIIIITIINILDKLIHYNIGVCMLKKVNIIGLFNDRNVLLSFKDNSVIITGENGSGKTHVINIIYYFLKKKFSKLVKLNFQSVIFTFESKKTINITITKNMLMNYVDIIEGDFRPPRSIIRIMPNMIWRRLVDKFKETQDINELYKVTENFLHQRGKDKEEIIHTKSIIKEVFSVNINQYFNQLYKYLNLFIKSKEIIYLPTYRRIEKDIKDMLDLELLNDRATCRFKNLK